MLERRCPMAMYSSSCSPIGGNPIDRQQQFVRPSRTVGVCVQHTSQHNFWTVERPETKSQTHKHTDTQTHTHTQRHPQASVQRFAVESRVIGSGVVADQTQGSKKRRGGLGVDNLGRGSSRRATKPGVVILCSGRGMVRTPCTSMSATLQRWNFVRSSFVL